MYAFVVTLRDHRLIHDGSGRDGGAAAPVTPGSGPGRPGPSSRRIPGTPLPIDLRLSSRIRVIYASSRTKMILPRSAGERGICVQ